MVLQRAEEVPGSRAASQDSRPPAHLSGPCRPSLPEGQGP